MASKKAHDPLMFKVVRLDLVDEDDEREGDFKVFYVDATKLRVRRVEMVRGEEVEHENVWVPWTSIRTLREL